MSPSITNVITYLNVPVKPHSCMSKLPLREKEFHCNTELGRIP